MKSNGRSPDGSDAFGRSETFRTPGGTAARALKAEAFALLGLLQNHLRDRVFGCVRHR
jgi:hypothetical protein